MVGAVRYGWVCDLGVHGDGVAGWCDVWLVVWSVVVHGDRSHEWDGVHVHGGGDECGRVGVGVVGVVGGDAWSGAGCADGCVGCSW